MFTERTSRQGPQRQRPAETTEAGLARGRSQPGLGRSRRKRWWGWGGGAGQQKGDGGLQAERAAVARGQGGPFPLSLQLGQGVAEPAAAQGLPGAAGEAEGQVAPSGTLLLRTQTQAHSPHLLLTGRAVLLGRGQYPQFTDEDIFVQTVK